MTALVHIAALAIAGGGGPGGTSGSPANLRWVGLGFIIGAMVVGLVRVVVCRDGRAPRARRTLDILAAVWLLVGVVLGAIGLALA